ncbi:Hypothetical Protein FCC1311_076132 [Hondaea fermentalgiana]|uniref:Uncharacterized protein n=1 Tax=Hondaea fermentalgiana TaxID=2315210 RepID=A0A2R5GM48_9STRA|nr:Hypothetical Protein FCC1311_076132 [Hondaea fermentalgiana]|eukprot:GBG31389.1 Hypothetical Protein FCC1311_076132 [Hondaea fermentalgiana]
MPLAGGSLAFMDCVQEDVEGEESDEEGNVHEVRDAEDALRNDMGRGKNSRTNRSKNDNDDDSDDEGGGGKITKRRVSFSEKVQQMQIPNDHDEHSDNDNDDDDDDMPPPLAKAEAREKEKEEKEKKAKSESNSSRGSFALHNFSEADDQVEEKKPKSCLKKPTRASKEKKNAGIEEEQKEAEPKRAVAPQAQPKKNAKPKAAPVMRELAPNERALTDAFTCNGGIVQGKGIEPKACTIQILPSRREIVLATPTRNGYHNDANAKRFALAPRCFTLDSVPGVQRAFCIRFFENEESETQYASLMLICEDAYCLARVLFCIFIIQGSNTSVRAFMYLLNVCLRGRRNGATSTILRRSSGFFKQHEREIQMLFPIARTYIINA